MYGYNNNLFADQDDSSEEYLALRKRYEDMMQSKKQVYLESDEYEIIIDGYMVEEEVGKALMASCEAAKQYPSDYGILLRQTYILSVVGRFAEALLLVARLQQDEDTGSELQMIKARIFMGLGLVKEGHQLLEQQLMLCSEDERVPLLLFAAESSLLAKDTTKALRYTKQALRLTPENLLAVHLMARCYGETSKIKECVRYYEKCLEMAPYDEAYWTELAEAYMRADMPQEAMRVFDEALASSSDFFKVALQKACLHMSFGQPKKALELFSDIQEQFPDNAEVMCTSGVCHVQLGQWKKAITCYKNAVLMDHNYADAYFGISSTLGLCGLEPELQREFLNYAIIMDPYEPLYMQEFQKNYVQKEIKEITKQTVKKPTKKLVKKQS